VTAIGKGIPLRKGGFGEGVRGGGGGGAGSSEGAGGNTKEVVRIQYVNASTLDTRESMDRHNLYHTHNHDARDPVDTHTHTHTHTHTRTHTHTHMMLETLLSIPSKAPV